MIARQVFRTIQPLKGVTACVSRLSSSSGIQLLGAGLALLQYRPCFVAKSTALSRVFAIMLLKQLQEVAPIPPYMVVLLLLLQR